MKRESRIRVMAGMLGMVLLAGYALTGKKSVEKEDREIYQTAVSLQDQVDQLGFTEFILEEYPVAMYDGKQEYVFYKGEIKQRKPVLETFVGTAYPVGDHFEVLVPTMEKMEGLLSLAGGTETLVSGSGYGSEQQIATIWHEACHAWQFTKFPVLSEKMEKRGQADISEAEWIVKEVDENAQIKGQLEKEMKLLEKGAEAALSYKNAKGNADERGAAVDEIKEVILKYKKQELDRKRFMTPEAVQAEQQCEQTEGMAYYVESLVFREQSGQKAYTKRYIESISTFEGGRGKYYRTGMAKCLMLDVLMPDWKEKLDFTKSLDQLLEEGL